MLSQGVYYAQERTLHMVLGRKITSRRERGIGDMSKEYLLGIFFGVAVGLILVVLLLRWTKKDGASKCKFDERQELVRGRGFKYAFFTLMICTAVYAFADSLAENRMIGSLTGVCICIVISCVVYACYCIWNEGYFALNENPKRVMVAFVLISLMNFAVFARSAMKGNLMENGVLSESFVNLFCGIMFLVIFAVLLLKYLKNRREAE